MTGDAELLRLRPGIHAATSESGQVHLIRWPHAESLGTLNEAQHAALRQLAGDRDTRSGFRRRVTTQPGEADTVDALIDKLRAGGWLCVTATEDGVPLYTVEPVGTAPYERSGCAPAESVPWKPVSGRVVLARNATLAPDGGQLVLAAPAGNCDIRLLDSRAVTVVHRLAGGAEVTELAGELEPPTVRRMIDDLTAAGVLDDGGEEEDATAARELRVRQWCPHELWFHAGSRLGGRRTLGESIGRTGRFDAVVAPPPALRAPFSGPAVPLARPDLDTLRTTDPPLTAVLEDRASVREHDHDNPLTLRQLGEFLYRCTSTREKVSPEGVRYLGRPYPSGGGSYELEFYPLVNRVDGLDAGLYRYDQHGHRLERIGTDDTTVRSINGVVTTLQALTEPPQVLFVLTARFGRVMWKYEAMAYALTLKHVGVTYQVMYLVATAMGLAPCAMGTGVSAEFSAAIGSDYLTESPVGEFLLGSKPPETAHAETAEESIAGERDG